MITIEDLKAVAKYILKKNKKYKDIVFHQQPDGTYRTEKDIICKIHEQFTKKD